MWCISLVQAVFSLPDLTMDYLVPLPSSDAVQIPVFENDFDSIDPFIHLPKEFDRVLRFRLKRSCVLVVRFSIWRSVRGQLHLRFGCAVWMCVSGSTAFSMSLSESKNLK
jgi:hypothetical protein